MIDLHMHSRESDGSLTPQALAAACRKAGVTAAALTDHDTVAGCRDFLSACAEEGIAGLAAVELSAEYSPGTMHILGYIPTASIDAFQQELIDVQSSRADRNQRILGVLADLGFPVDATEVAKLAGQGMTGRPHIAAAMQALGYVKNRQEAFARFLGKGCPAYCERYRLTPKTCVQKICAHGGVAVLAHPFTLGLSEQALRACIADLVSFGLAGLEVFYPEHHDDRRRCYQRLAREFNLIETGGSDFHGDMNPAIMIGRGFGNLHVPDSGWEKLLAHIQVPDPDVRLSATNR